MRCALFFLACLAAVTTPGVAVMAANSTNGAPPSAEKEGGVAGDPRGAIRALGGTSQNDYKPEHNKVDVPKLGGGKDVGRGGTPPGTTGPR